VPVDDVPAKASFILRLLHEAARLRPDSEMAAYGPLLSELPAGKDRMSGTTTLVISILERIWASQKGLAPLAQRLDPEASSGTRVGPKASAPWPASGPPMAGPAHMGHLPVKRSSIHRLIAAFPAAMSKQRPGPSPSLSWSLRARTNSHPVGAHRSRTTIPHTSDRAQGGETILATRL
jgi:hypothetical protein